MPRDKCKSSAIIYGWFLGSTQVAGITIWTKICSSLYEFHLFYFPVIVLAFFMFDCCFYYLDLEVSARFDTFSTVQWFLNTFNITMEFSWWFVSILKTSCSFFKPVSFVLINPYQHEDVLICPISSCLSLNIFLAFEQWTLWTASFLSVSPVACWKKSNQAWLPFTKAMMTLASVFIPLFAFCFKQSYQFAFYKFQTYCHVIPCCPPESIWHISFFWHWGSLNKNTVANGSTAFIPKLF